MGTTLYDGSTNFISANPGLSGLGVPGVRWFAYGQFPIFPQSPNAGTATLNTNLGTGNTGYVGYTNYDPLSVLSPPFKLLNSTFPILDSANGFTFSFNVAVTAETSNPNRAGFNITLIGSDGKGIELGFKEQGANDRIFTQNANFTEGEFGTTTINAATNYVVTVLGNNYTLSANGTNILTGALRNYDFNPAASNPPIPFNPYISPNFLFLGDNTDQGNSTFTLGAISVNSFPIATLDNDATNEDVPLVVTTNGVLANDSDANGDPLTAVLEQEPTNGTLALNPDGSFTYTPVAHFSGTDSFTYRANDGTANSNTPVTVAIAVNAVADAPTLSTTPATGDINAAIPVNINPALVDTDGSETLSIQIAGVPSTALLNKGTNLGNGLWQLSLAQVAGLTITPTTGSDFNLTVTATATETSNNNAASTVANLSVVVNEPGQPNPEPNPEPKPEPEPGQLTLKSTPNKLLFLEGGASQAPIKFKLTGRDTNLVNEVGVFVALDEQGTILDPVTGNSIAPGQEGYLKAALSTGTVIFSALSDGEFDTLSFSRQLTLSSGEYWGFYLVQNSTTDTVLANLAAGQTSSNVFFATTSANADGFAHLQVSEQGNSAFALAWEESLGGGDNDFNDLELTVELASTPFLLGTNVQGEPERELIDLTDQTGQLSVNVIVNSDAAFDNFVGLYVVDDQQGTVNGITPGQAGYAQAALQRRVLDLNKNAQNPTALLDGGVFLAPYIITDATADEFLAQNPTNQSGQGPLAYFAYSGANPDGMDHVRLLGDNTLGFEDLFNGGDKDFNDMVLQVNFV